MAEQTPPDDQVALIDLDGTTADYDGTMVRELNMIAGPGEQTIESIPYGDELPPWLDRRMDLIKRQPGFWENLPPIDLGLDICSLLRDEMGFRLMVLTKGPKRTHDAWTEKVRWAQKYLPKAGVTITYEGREYDKGLTYGKVMFDDFPPYILNWLKHRPRGKVLMLDNRYNKHFEHPNVLRIERVPQLSSEVRTRIWDFIKGGGT